MRRIALYSHDAQGLGHMRRNLAIAQALSSAEESTVLLVAGAREAALFPLPANTDLLTLPALRKGSGGRYRSRSLGLDLAEMVALRADILGSALTAFEPDVLIVDKLPGGVEGELLDCLAPLKAGGTRLVLGLREVLDDPDRVASDWLRSDFEDVVREHYDALWVYGDPRVYDPVWEYELAEDLAERVRYSGYIDRRDGRPPTPDELAEERALHDLPAGPLCLCMAGGGEDGHRLLDAFTRARMPRGTTGVVVTGPLMPAEQRAALEARAEERGDLRLIGFTTDGDRLIRLADSVVAMGGYNTSCEILASGARALIVPRVHPRREQLIRAERLAARGAVDMLHPDDLDPAALTRWLAAPPAAPASRGTGIDLSGLRRLPAMLTDVLQRPSLRPTGKGAIVAAA
jgi:predicted glycosyltransferase